jgi:hypothetical protein
VTTNQTLEFSCTAIDLMASDLVCNLTVDNTPYPVNLTSGGINTSIMFLGAGYHYWNVTCIDYVGNANTSQTWSILIPLPDAEILPERIMFNNTMPEEGKNITINATVRNAGETDLENLVVQFFDGNYTTGLQIGNNMTVNLSAGANITLNVSWRVSSIGIHNIFVVLDPPMPLGMITESDETNNIAYSPLEVSSYTVAYGNLTGLTSIMDLTNSTVFRWNISMYNGTKIFAVDKDSSISWDQLYALSRTLTDAYSPDDFDQIDVSLMMENTTDSINRTWTLAGNPRAVKSYEVYARQIDDVPIVNSTINANFTTGIMWDASDGNTEYDGTQDVVFVTTVNVGQLGKLGLYDYELKIPANLRLYTGGDMSAVALYTELP